MLKIVPEKIIYYTYWEKEARIKVESYARWHKIQGVMQFDDFIVNRPNGRECKRYLKSL